MTDFFLMQFYILKRFFLLKISTTWTQWQRRMFRRNFETSSQHCSIWWHRNPSLKRKFFLHFQIFQCFKIINSSFQSFHRTIRQLLWRWNIFLCCLQWGSLFVRNQIRCRLWLACFFRFYRYNKIKFQTRLF